MSELDSAIATLHQVVKRKGDAIDKLEKGLSSARARISALEWERDLALKRIAELGQDHDAITYLLERQRDDAKNELARITDASKASGCNDSQLPGVVAGFVRRQQEIVVELTEELSGAKRRIAVLEATQNPGPRVLKAGEVPPRLMPGMVVNDLGRPRDVSPMEETGYVYIAGNHCHADNRARFPLAEDFTYPPEPVPHPAPFGRRDVLKVMREVHADWKRLPLGVLAVVDAMLAELPNAD